MQTVSDGSQKDISEYTDIWRVNSNTETCDENRSKAPWRAWTIIYHLRSRRHNCSRHNHFFTDIVFQQYQCAPWAVMMLSRSRSCRSFLWVLSDFRPLPKKHISSWIGNTKGKKRVSTGEWVCECVRENRCVFPLCAQFSNNRIKWLLNECSTICHLFVSRVILADLKTGWGNKHCAIDRIWVAKKEQISL